MLYEVVVHTLPYDVINEVMSGKFQLHIVWTTTVYYVLGAVLADLLKPLLVLIEVSSQSFGIKLAVFSCLL